MNQEAQNARSDEAEMQSPTKTREDLSQYVAKIDNSSKEYEEVISESGQTDKS